MLIDRLTRIDRNATVRETARQIVGADRFVSVGLGADDSTRADLVLPADTTPVDEVLDRIVALLQRRGLIG